MKKEGAPGEEKVSLHSENGKANGADPVILAFSLPDVAASSRMKTADVRCQPFSLHLFLLSRAFCLQATTGGGSRQKGQLGENLCVAKTVQ
jgi:hypothetical protein